ncbi:MAG: hypothetical protein GX384_02155 [Clostridiaceae bacterium]|jgi:hypothetical protein|nr:hypothetical protein [Bacillota bacterium]NLI38137.1 hypothetical protein [Clostridiaceae bacterium]
MGGIRTKKPAIIIGFYTGVITGVLIGLAVMTTIVSYRLENFHRMNAYLESVITEKNAQLEQLEKSVNKGKYIVKSIDVVFLCDYEGVDILLFETELKKKYNALLGKEVKTLDAEMIAEVADKRIFRLDNGQYQLFVKKLILAENLKIWVEIHPLG